MPFSTANAYYAVLLSRGLAWNHRLARDEQPGIAGHRACLASLLARGTMPIGGPFVDTLGGLTVLRAASPDEARRIIDAASAVRSKLLTADVRRWNMVVTPAKP